MVLSRALPFALIACATAPMAAMGTDTTKSCTGHLFGHTARHTASRIS